MYHIIIERYIFLHINQTWNYDADLHTQLSVLLLSHLQSILNLNAYLCKNNTNKSNM